MKKHTHSLPLNMVHQLQHESRDAESNNEALLLLDSQWCDTKGGRVANCPTDKCATLALLKCDET
jgi:hypothetical protein